MMMRAADMVGIGLLALSFPQHAVGMSTKQKQRNACSGMSSGDVSNVVKFVHRKRLWL